MDGIGNALHLGGYGIYVWPAFATAAVVLCWMAVSTLRRLRDNERNLDTLQQTRGKPAGAATPGEEGTNP
jgi:heme exporter protein D